MLLILHICPTKCMIITHSFSQEAWDELNVVMEAVREDINITCNAFMKDDKEVAQRVAPLGSCDHKDFVTS